MHNEKEKFSAVTEFLIGATSMVHPLLLERVQGMSDNELRSVTRTSVDVVCVCALEKARRDGYITDDAWLPQRVHIEGTISDDMSGKHINSLRITCSKVNYENPRAP